MKLNLGSGRRKIEGFVNVDKFEIAQPDVIWDLERTPWRFAKTGSVTEIRAVHILEHLGRDPDVFNRIMIEMYRVLVPHGAVEIKTPHYRCDTFWADPTHVRAISPEGMALYSKANCRMFAEKGWASTPLADYLDVDFEVENVGMKLIPPWLERQRDGQMTDAEVRDALRTVWNVVDEVSFTLRKVGPPFGDVA